jgi:FkbM family methyltransferase
MLGPVEKVRLVARTVANWPLVIMDKAGFADAPVYRLRSGLTFLCRGRTPDIDEVVVICSGREYPISLLRGLSPHDVVLDVGANIGAFSVFLAHEYRGCPLRGWAIEPFPPNVRVLRQNLALNDVHFVVAEVAISDSDGEVRIDDRRAVDAIAVVDNAIGQAVEARRLSTFCADNDIDLVNLLKLDVEGHEYRILSADRDFIRHHVQRIIMEWHSTEDGDRDTIVSALRDAFMISDIRTERSGGILFMRNVRH